MGESHPRREYHVAVTSEARQARDSRQAGFSECGQPIGASTFDAWGTALRAYAWKRMRAPSAPSPYDAVPAFTLFNYQTAYLQ